jgi:hypothetical protein
MASPAGGARGRRPAPLRAPEDIRSALAAAAGALLVASHAWALFGQEIPGDEGGVTHYRLQSFHAGFYLWLASFLILAASLAVLLWRRRSGAGPYGASPTRITAAPE